MSPILNHNQMNSKMSTISIAGGPANGQSTTVDKIPGNGNIIPDKNGVVLQGYLKKLTTMKKRYFILFSDSGEKLARLEYYENEKKFRTRPGQPKRSIVLKSCFHINRRLGTKQKFVIALYTKDDSFGMVLENETEMNKWLKALLALHRIDDTEVDVPRTNFEHVWEVQVHRRGLAVDKNIVGSYHLCLTDKALRLAQIGSKITLSGEPRMPFVEFQLTTIRRCGDSQRFFYMEVGRHSAIGAGELYMETEDPLIAQNMHTTIINAMSTVNRNNRDELGPVTRNRSSSANEASKPISMLHRRQTHVGNKPLNFSPSGGESGFEQEDSLQSNTQHADNTMEMVDESTGSSIVTIITRNDNAGISETEDVIDSISQSIEKTSISSGANEDNSFNAADYRVQPPSSAIKSTNIFIGNESGSNLVRDRCDSLPSRNRTTSDCTTHINIQNQSMPPPRTIPLAISNRPHSMYTSSYRHSNSPPVINQTNPGPLSPSIGCSESDGSSLSIDEPDGCFTSLTPDDVSGFGLKYYNTRPHGPSIPEENDDFWNTAENTNHMSTSSGSLSLPLQQNQMTGSVETNSPYGNSPAGDHVNSSGYMVMSPAIDYNKSLYTGSSSGPHSQASSLADECGDSYVPVQAGVVPGEEYIDMESNRQHPITTNTSSISSAASSCSITSGTPSTDMRFAEYQLDKVVSHFTPDDEESNFMVERPIRAYSVGSRLEHNKRKMRVDMLSSDHGNHSPSSRVRAFSVGSRAKVARSDLYHGSLNTSQLTKTASQDIANLISTINKNNRNNNNNSSVTNFNNNNNNSIGLTSTNRGLNIKNNNNNNSSKKSASTPLLANINTKSISIDPMDDLMEIDFTKKDDDSLSTDSNYDHKHISCDDLMEIDYPQHQAYVPSAAAVTTPRTGPNRRKSTNIPASGASGNNTPVRVSQPVPIVKRMDTHANVMPLRQSFSIDQVEQQKDKDGYINMKPIGSGSMDLGDASRSTTAFNKSVYGQGSNLSSSPLKTAASKIQSSQQRQDQNRSSGLSQVNTDDYLNMSPISVRSTVASQQQQVPQISSGSAPEGYMEMSWGRPSSNNNNDNTNLSTNLKKNEQSSSSSISSSTEYINMNFGGNIPRTSSASSDCSSGSTGNRTETGSARTNANSRQRSLPITIKSKKSQQQRQQAQSVNHLPNHHHQHHHHLHQNFSASNIYPPDYLELNGINSSALTASDSSTDSGIATPTAGSTVHSNSTIFPFSPNSPNNGTNKQTFSSQQMPSEEQKRKCFVDGTTGTLKLSECDNKNNQTNEVGQTQTTPLDVLSSDYADMSLGSSNSRTVRNTGPTLSPRENIKKLKSSFFGYSDENRDYVNCAGKPKPSSNTAVTKSDKQKDDNAGEYAVMNPRRIVAQQPPLSSGNASVTLLSTKKSILVTSNNNPDKVLANTQSKTSIDGFKPIASHMDNEILMHGTKSNQSYGRQFSVPLEKHRILANNSSGYELLELRANKLPHNAGSNNNRTTRPNSVNSEKTSKYSSQDGHSAAFTPLMRPNSANSERQVSCSLSSSALAGNEMTLSNGGNCSSLTSSSSTLCGSGTITRPHSSTFLSSGSENSQASRPSSVISISDTQPTQGALTTSIASRPPSVSSERELHYASLDLPPCAPSTTPITGVSNGTYTATANAVVETQPSCTYSQIDFIRSQENNNNSSSKSS